MKNARLFFSAFFFLCGIAAFAAIPWLQPVQNELLLKAEPYFQCPVPVFSGLAMIRSDSSGKGFFGASRNGNRTHQGVDLLVAIGNPIFSSKSGRVVHAGIGKGYGWYVELLHPDGHSTRYAHLGSLFVSKGDWVSAKQKLGRAGKSGNADHPKTLPHLHFEIRENDKSVDPVRLMEPSIKVR